MTRSEGSIGFLGTSYGDSLGTGIDKERKRRKYKERVPVKGDQR